MQAEYNVAGKKKEEGSFSLPLHAFFEASFLRSLNTFVGGNGILDRSTITVFFFRCFSLIVFSFEIFGRIKYCADYDVKQQNFPACLAAFPNFECRRKKFRKVGFRNSQRFFVSEKLISKNTFP